MSTQAITPEQAQQRLDQRKRDVKVKVGTSAPDTAVAVGEVKLKIVSNLTESERAARQKESDDVAAIRQTEKVALMMRLAQCPARHFGREVDRSRCPAWSEKEKLIKSNLGKGFIRGIVGVRGNGKTQIAVECCRAVCAAGRRAKFVTAEMFLMDVKATFAEGSRRTERDVIAQYRKPSLLVVDEMDGTSQKEWQHRLFVELLNWRYNDQTDTLLIANWTKKELEDAVGPKLCSRIKETGGVVECNWPSFR